MSYIKGGNGRVFQVPNSVGESMIASGHVERATEEEYRGQRSEPVSADSLSLADPAQDPPAGQVVEPGSEDPPAPDGAEPASAGQAPAGNASRDDWAAHAVSLGFAEEQVEGLGREDIKKLIEQ